MREVKGCGHNDYDNDGDGDGDVLMITGWSDNANVRYTDEARALGCVLDGIWVWTGWTGLGTWDMGLDRESQGWLHSVSGLEGRLLAVYDAGNN
jgi:hypothetical protein